MTQNINSFSLGKEVGQLDLQNSFPARVLSCYADSSLVAGQAVKLVDGTDKMPHVTAVTADTDEVFGYVVYSIKKGAISSGMVIEVALTGSVMFMTAGAAIAKNIDVMFVTATGKVITATGVTKWISGRTLDKAAADGDVIRVYINSFANSAHPAA